MQYAVSVVERVKVNGAIDYAERRDLRDVVVASSVGKGLKGAGESVLGKLGEGFMLVGSNMTSQTQIRVIIQSRVLLDAPSAPPTSHMVSRPPARR
mgnify:CR=1 FL=1